MVYRPQVRRMSFGGFDRPPPPDVIVLLAVVFVTYSLGFFTPVLEWLRLTRLAWSGPYVWQIVTYPWIGAGAASIWILLELLILYWFIVEVFRSLGRKRFWRLIVYSTVAAGVVATVTDIVMSSIGAGNPLPFQLMQGQRMLIVIAIAGFATLHGYATILLFFILPIQARWFIWIEIAIAFIGFLGTKDLAGFLGICVAVWLTVWLLRGGRGRRGGGLRELRLRLERWWIQRKLGGRRRRSGLHLVRPGERGRDDPDEWIH